MKQKAELKCHIINNARTKDIYNAYQKSCYRNDYWDAFGDAMEMHETTKAVFDALGKTPIPKTAQFFGEYAALLEEKKPAMKREKKQEAK